MLPPTHESDSTRNASLRCSPCTTIAWAMMKLPMNSITVSSVNRPNTTSTAVSSSGGGGVASSSAQSATASSAVTGIGIASVTHQTTTKARIAASRCWLPSRSNGISSIAANTIGPRKSPTVRRFRSKRSSAADRRPSCSSSVR